MALQEILEKEKNLVDSALLEYLADIKPQKLNQAVQYAVFPGGKRLRPILAILSFRASSGKNIEEIVPIACAIELIHTFSMIHDDLPCMDDAKLRRGKPTLHIEFDEAMAVLTGDALFARAFELLSRKKEKNGRLIALVSETTGSSGVLGGQVLDIDQDKRFVPSVLRRLHLNKTAKLIALPLQCGAMVAGADDKIFNTLTDAGIFLGMAFQIKDDLLDITVGEAKLGKSTGKDLLGNRLTYPRLYSTEGAQFRMRSYAKRAKRLFSSLSESYHIFNPITDFVVRRSF